MPDNPYESTQVKDELSDPAAADSMDGVVSMLRQTKPWVRFISVMMFLGCGFLLLGGLVMIIGGATGAVGIPAGVGSLLGSIYIVMSLFYIVPGLFLWRYADGITVFVRERSRGALEAALEAQKSFWKFVGILMLVIIAIYALAIVFVLVGASMWSVSGTL